nr:barstar family protein [Sphingomonas gellani]
MQGGAIRDIPSFYEEINRVFMSAEDWSLGQSLDALDDMLRGGYGAIEGREPVRLIWRDMEHSRAALGTETTRAYLTAKLDQPGRYNMATIGRQLAELEGGTGQTYFEIVLAIIAEHANIALVAA